MHEPILLRVFVISDATGRTAESVITAALLQFPRIEPRITRFPNVRTKEQILSILDRARQTKGIVIYSLVVPELREFIQREGTKRELILFDLIGPILERVRKLFNLIPTSTPGLLEHVRAESLRAAEAIEFTMRHDDGLGLETIDQAHLIILGVSRVSKTPTSLYLACNQFLRVANVPVLPNQELPQEVVRSDVPKVGLIIQPEQLIEIRRQRARYAPDYADPHAVLEELEHCTRLFRKIPGMPVIDVTHLSIEESASRIMKLLAPDGLGRRPKQH